MLLVADVDDVVDAVSCLEGYLHLIKLWELGKITCWVLRWLMMFV